MAASIQIVGCEICQGVGVIKGIFHRMTCAACHGGGIVNGDTGEALDPLVLVVELRRRLTAALKQAERQGQGGGPGNDYVGRQNRAGTGGGNWTGD